jgi:DNA-directed RNA polymerase specialized sigma24 family protein
MLLPSKVAFGSRESHHGKPSFAENRVPLSVEIDASVSRGRCPRSAALRLDGTLGVMSPSPPGRKASRLTQEAFDGLLAFLGPTREEGARRYEEIRRRLTKIFVCRGCATPEELVDECIDRVAGKVAELAPTYEGDPALYFYGVARWVFRESLKKRPFVAPPPEPDPSEERERELDCLEGCMQSLPPEQRSLIRDYYREEKSARIEHRKTIAARMGIEVNALRIRAHRIRTDLQKCVTACLGRGEAGALPAGSP